MRACVGGHVIRVIRILGLCSRTLLPTSTRGMFVLTVRLNSFS